MSIEDLLSKGESQLLSFISSFKTGKAGKRMLKKSVDICGEIAASLCGMANAEGGTVLIGIEKNSDITGIERSEDKIVDIFDHSGSLLLPRQELKFAIAELKGKRILTIEIERSPIPVKLEDGRYLMRFWKRDYPMPASDLISLKKGKLNIFYEREFVEDATVGDLDNTLIEKLCGDVKWSGDPLKLLREQYRLIDFKGDRAKVTKAALLLFAPDQLRWNPGSGIDFMKFSTSAGQEEGKEVLVDRIRINAPIMKLIDRTFENLKSRIRERKRFYDLFMVEKYEYPTLAWQEAILNAIAHRDYSMHGTPIEIKMYEDRLEIRSPGLLPEPYSLERIAFREKSHVSRNPLIARVLSDSGYLRERGEGIHVLFDSMENNNLRPPEFREEGFIFCVILQNATVFDDRTQAWLQGFAEHKLNARQRRILAWAYNHGGRFSNRDYQMLGKVDRDVAYREILEMEKLSIVSSSAKGKYRIAEARL